MPECGRQAAQRGAQRHRQRREGQAGEAHRQPAAERPTQRHVARRSRPRAHPDATLRSDEAPSLRSTSLLTVAIRGHFAARMRALSESRGMGLAKLLKDALLVYEGDIEGGYEPGTSLRQWQERHSESEERTE